MEQSALSSPGEGAEPTAVPAPSAPSAPSGELVIDCDACDLRDIACHDCVVSVLLGPVAVPVRLVPREEVALAALAESGLVPPLRHRVRPAASSPLAM